MAEFLAPPKRASTSLQQEGNYQCTKNTNPVEVLSFRHLKNVSFPSEILALPHVLKQIDTLLLTPKEAMVEAAGTGDIDWMNELLKANSCFALDAVEAAAANGHLGIVQVLYNVNRKMEKVSPENLESLKKAVVAAAKKGYADIVEYLLPRLYPNEIPSVWMYEGDYRSLVWEVFTVSAVNGHVEVLKLMMGTEQIKLHLDWYLGGALSLAIAGQHADVVDFLLANPDFDWDWMDAFEEAIARGQTATARGSTMRIRIAADAELVSHGRKDAVEYLFNNGRNDLDLVHDAFVEATATGSTDVARFLHGTGLVSMDAFEKAWERAPSCWWRDPDIMLYLYGLKRASSLMINQWFERVSSSDVLKRLYENEAIPDSFIVAAFSRAARCESNEDVKVLKWLYLNKAIPSDAIDKAFVGAVGQHRADVFQLLQCDSRLTAKGIAEGFVEAAGSGQQGMVEALYDQRQISPSVLLEAFERAVSTDDFDLVKMLKYLSADKLKAFLYAAKLRQSSVLKIIVGAEVGTDRSTN